MNVYFEGESLSELDLIDKIINPIEIFIKYHSIDEYLNNWFNIAFEESKAYLLYQMARVNFTFNIGAKTEIILRNILKDYSTSQDYCIIYNSITNATRYYQENNISRRRAANSVITNMERRYEKALSNNWDITHYKRDRRLGQSGFSYFFYYKILLTDREGFNMIPSKRNIEILLNKRKKYFNEEEYY